MDTFPRMLLFPEGTTTNGKVLISFQLGAFIPGHPIQPVIVRYPHVHFDQSWYDLISSVKTSFLFSFSVLSILCTLSKYLVLSCLGGLFLWLSLCLECLLSFIILWRYDIYLFNSIFQCFVPQFSKSVFWLNLIQSFLDWQVEYLPIIVPPDHQKQNAVHFAERVSVCLLLIYFCYFI